MNIEIPPCGHSINPFNPPGKLDWHGTDGLPHSLTRVAILMQSCVDKVKPLIEDGLGDLNHAALEWERTGRKKAWKRIEPLFSTRNIPERPYGVADETNSVRTIPMRAFNNAAASAFNGNLELVDGGMPLIEVERDIARCFIFTQKRLFDIFSTNLRAHEDYLRKEAQRAEDEKFKASIADLHRWSEQRKEEEKKRLEAERAAAEAASYSSYDDDDEDIDDAEAWVTGRWTDEDRERERREEIERAQDENERRRKKAGRHTPDHPWYDKTYFDLHPERICTYEYDYDNWKKRKDSLLGGIDW